LKNWNNFLVAPRSSSPLEDFEYYGYENDQAMGMQIDADANKKIACTSA
jgi:hypothetical protein